MDDIKEISIIGKGAFGSLLASLVPTEVAVHSYDKEDTARNIAYIGASDVIFLAIPLQSYPEVLALLRPHLKETSLVVDICSVKVKPAELIATLLPGHKNVLLTHPLFGPETYNTQQKHVLVVTSELNQKGEIIVGFCKSTLSLDILEMSNEEHDKRMAEIHALTFFIARGLTALGIHSEPFMTPSFQSLLNLSALDKKHTQELFETIEIGNPYAADERQKFLEELQKVHSQLGKKSG